MASFETEAQIVPGGEMSDDELDEVNGGVKTLDVDVCKTPTSPAPPVPVPYPNVSFEKGEANPGGKPVIK